ncbi:hypothetical protein, partial [Escherichia coli]|uniref:hypothetical protein n=1 Tax=Escherichia coli TaxID=562 RepID=UPI001954609F
MNRKKSKKTQHLTCHQVERAAWQASAIAMTQRRVLKPQMGFTPAIDLSREKRFGAKRLTLRRGETSSQVASGLP